MLQNKSPVPVLFEDEHIVVVDKPPGLVVDPSETHKQTTLAEIMQQDFGIKLDRAGIVHRLDKDTSGILLVAKTQKVLENLQQQFKERQVKKAYLALVHGLIKGKGVVKGAIARHPGHREKFTVSLEGKVAETEYQEVEQFQISDNKLETIFSDFNTIQMRKLKKMKYGQFSLLKVTPKTGRTHQIRVHLKYIGHPVVADGKYGGRKTVRLDHRWCKRQFLHASRIEFTHPVTGEKMILESKLPGDLKKALEFL